MNTETVRVQAAPCPLFRVDVSRQGGMWLAECADLGVVTEAESYELLVARVWDVAPELYGLNAAGGAAAAWGLDFVHRQVYAPRAEAV